MDSSSFGEVSPHIHVLTQLSRHVCSMDFVFTERNVMCVSAKAFGQCLVSWSYSVNDCGIFFAVSFNSFFSGHSAREVS